MDTSTICTKGIDYYGVLGINKCASNLEIKDAYRKLAMQYNPERNNDPSLYGLFTLVGEAYEVLSSPLLKAIYDQYGEAGLKKGVVTPYGYNPPYVYHRDPIRTFKDFFGTSSPYADLLTSIEKPPRMFDFGQGKALKQKEKPYVKPLLLKLEEVYHGGLKIIKVQRKVYRDELEDVADIQEKLLNITIPPGVPPGTQITFPESGDQGPTVIPGDIVFVVEDRPHPVFKREGVNLSMTTNITVEQSLVGTVLVINTLDDRTLRVAITQVVTPEYVKIVHGEGMPYPNDRDKKGDLHIKFHVEYPTFIPQNSKKMIARAFAYANAQGKDQESKMEAWSKIVRDDKISRMVPPPPTVFNNQPGIVQVGPNLFVQPPPQKMASLASRNQPFMPMNTSAPPPILPLDKRNY